MEDALPSTLRDHLLGVLFGQALGDAIGLLTEFMTRNEAETYYGQQARSAEGLQLGHKVPDMHRERWAVGDWTDDTDQMICIMQSLTACNGVLDQADIGQRIKHWARRGFAELGDVAGMGLGATTSHVLRHPQFDTSPAAAAEAVWQASGREAAPNGAAMRTGILGVHDFYNLDRVAANAAAAAQVTHADPRCIASCVAVSVAIAQLLQGQKDHRTLLKTAYSVVKETVKFAQRAHKRHFKRHLFATRLSELKLDEAGKIGYTLKALGAGFWALRQTDFRAALTELTLQAGDADTNGAVAGALLGAKVGYAALPSDWLSSLKHADWLYAQINEYVTACVDNLRKGDRNGAADDASVMGRAPSTLRVAMSSQPSAPSQPPPYDEELERDTQVKNSLP